MTGLRTPGDGPSPLELEQRWRRVDTLLSHGAYSPDMAIRLLIERGLVRKAMEVRLVDPRNEMWMLEPARENLVPGPRILLRIGLGRLYGAARLYRPVRDLMLPDTGAFASPVPSDPDERDER